MKLTKKFLESLIREAMEEANCRGNELGEMNCGGKRDDDTLEEEEIKNPGKYKKKDYDKDGDGVPNGADSDPKDGSKK